MSDPGDVSGSFDFIVENVQAMWDIRKGRQVTLKMGICSVGQDAWLLLLAFPLMTLSPETWFTHHLGKSRPKTICASRISAMANLHGFTNVECM